MNRLGPEEDARGVDGHNLVPAIQRQAGQLHACSLAAGRVDRTADARYVAKHIDPPVFLLDSFGKGGPFVLLSGVEMAVSADPPAATISPETRSPSSSCRSQR